MCACVCDWLMTGLHINCFHFKLLSKNQDKVKATRQSLTLSATMSTAIASTPRAYPGFTSAISQTGGRRGVSGTFCLKVVRARITEFINNRPNYQKLGQIFIDITEATANIFHVTAAAQWQFGDNHVIVTADGLEVKLSTGMQRILHAYWFLSICFSPTISFKCRTQVLEGELQEIFCSARGGFACTYVQEKEDAGDMYKWRQWNECRCGKEPRRNTRRARVPSEQDGRVVCSNEGHAYPTWVQNPPYRRPEM